jgi:hypothetical protein
MTKPLRFETHHRDTTAALKDDIDRGLAGDKVNASDPSAAPLGTDEEAADTPPTREAIRLARYTEIEQRRARDRADDLAPAPDHVLPHKWLHGSNLVRVLATTIALGYLVYHLL